MVIIFKVIFVFLFKLGFMLSCVLMEKLVLVVLIVFIIIVSFGVLVISDFNVFDVLSGFYWDGCIWNFVFSKLKGKIDGFKGNFSVMYIDVVGRMEVMECDVEVKRISESIEFVVKWVYENGYVLLWRSWFIYIFDELELVVKFIVLL